MDLSTSLVTDSERPKLRKRDDTIDANDSLTLALAELQRHHQNRQLFR
jgi:hypothetical protein